MKYICRIMEYKANSSNTSKLMTSELSIVVSSRPTYPTDLCYAIAITWEMPFIYAENMVITKRNRKRVCMMVPFDATYASYFFFHHIFVIKISIKFCKHEVEAPNCHPRILLQNTFLSHLQRPFSKFSHWNGNRPWNFMLFFPTVMSLWHYWEEKHIAISTEKLYKCRKFIPMFAVHSAIIFSDCYIYYQYKVRHSSIMRFGHPREILVRLHLIFKESML